MEVRWMPRSGMLGRLLELSWLKPSIYRTKKTNAGTFSYYNFQLRRKQVLCFDWSTINTKRSGARY